MFFQALYIDPEQQGGDRVVLLEPAVEDLHVAYYVLKTFKFDGFPGIVVQMQDKDTLEKFNQAVDKISDGTVQNIFDKIVEIAKTMGEVVWQRPPKAAAVTAATHIPLPTASRYPKGMNPRSKGIWLFVLRNYLDVIRSYDTAEKQWAAAIILFKRVCYKNTIKPFTYVPQAKRPEQEVAEDRAKLVEKVKTGYDKANLLIDTFFDNLTSYGWTSFLEKEWKYKGVEKVTRFAAMLWKNMILNTSKTYHDGIDYLTKFEGFRKVDSETCELKIDSVTSIVYMKHVKKANYMYAIIKFSFDKHLAALLLNIPENTDNSKIMSGLRTWTKDMFI